MASPGATLTEGPVRGHLVALTVPMIWGIAAIMSLHVVDTWFVAQLGERHLAAMSFTFPVTFTLVSLGIGLMAGTASVISRVLGQGDITRVRRLTTDAALLGTAVAVVFTAIGLLTIDGVFVALGADEEILPLIRDYMVTWYAGFFFFLVPMVGLGAVRATGDSRLQSRIMIASALANLILDPLLIFGLAGFPRMELQGAALATVIARALSFAAGYWALHYRKHFVTHTIPPIAEFLWSCRQVLRVGLPAAGTNMIIPLATGIIVALLARHGPNAVAGFGAATRIEQIVLVPYFAMSSMIGPFVGQNLGAGQYARIEQALELSGRFCAASGVLIAVVLAAAAPLLMGQFADQPEVIHTGVLYLWIVPLSFGMAGLVMVVNAAFNGLGLPLPGVAVSVTRMVLLYLPLAWLLSLWWGIAGVFIGAALANILSGVGAWLWIRRVCRRLGEPVRSVAASMEAEDVNR
ncbi:MAG: MATE family efflux transporter [Gammaproteobacteria bacterium]|nr:MATE family efflux transporter [Gammaproteobacteria bacterium]